MRASPLDPLIEPLLHMPRDYNLVWRPAVEKHLGNKFSNGPKEGCAALVDLAVRREFLTSHRALPWGESCLTLTTAGAARLNLPPRFARPTLTPSVLRDSFATLYFHVMNEPQRPIFNPDTIARYWSRLGLVIPDLKSIPHYKDTDRTGTQRLGLLVVDYGSEPHQLLKRCHRYLVDRAKRSPGFQSLLKAHRIVIAIATTEPTKAAGIENVFRQEYQTPPIRKRFLAPLRLPVVVPGLKQLIGQVRNKS